MKIQSKFNPPSQVAQIERAQSWFLVWCVMLPALVVVLAIFAAVFMAGYWLGH